VIWHQIILTLSSIVDICSKLGISPKEVVGFIAFIYTSAIMLWQGRVKQWKKMAKSQCLHLLNEKMTNKEKVQTVVDYLQKRSKILAVLPDEWIHEMVNEVYVNKVKPKADVENLWKDKTKSTESLHNQVKDILDGTSQPGTP
jgi:hypothetical protein